MIATSDENTEIPKWDEALEALVKEECSQKGGVLMIEDFSRIARVHSIRFDDIMETVFALCINGQWQYTNSNGSVHSITQDEVDRLYVERRIYEKDLRDYTGTWSPLNA